MKYSSLTQRITSSPAENETPIDPWAVHNLAMQRVAEGDAITMLSIGQETDETTPELVVDAAVGSLRAGRHHYVDVRGEDKLRAAIAGYHEHLTAQTTDKNLVTVFTGAQNALYSVAQALLDVDDEVLLVAPFYTTYEGTFSASGAKAVTVQVTAADGYTLDVNQLLDAVTDRTRAIVINTPNNPLGGCYTQAQINAIADVCIARDIWLIMDTVYLDLVAPGTVPIPHKLAGIEKVLVTIGSLSKSHRMTGWRVGWVIGPAELARHLGNLSVCMHYGIPPFVQDAAVVAIEQAHTTPQTVRTVMQERRKLLLQHLDDVSPAKLIDAGQGMFILLDVEPLGQSAYDFAMGLLAAKDVSVLPCDGFGPGGRYLVRIGLCVDGQYLVSAGRKICQYIREQS